MSLFKVETPEPSARLPECERCVLNPCTPVIGMTDNSAMRYELVLLKDSLGEQEQCVTGKGSRLARRCSRRHREEEPEAILAQRHALLRSGCRRQPIRS